jgi:hypothetical protein
MQLREHQFINQQATEEMCSVEVRNGMFTPHTLNPWLPVINKGWMEKCIPVVQLLCNSTTAHTKPVREVTLMSLRQLHHNTRVLIIIIIIRAFFSGGTRRNGVPEPI